MMKIKAGAIMVGGIASYLWLLAVAVAVARWANGGCMDFSWYC